MKTVPHTITGNFKQTFEVNEKEAKNFVIKYLYKRFNIPYNALLSNDAKSILTSYEYKGEDGKKYMEHDFVRYVTPQDVVILKALKILEYKTPKENSALLIGTIPRNFKNWNKNPDGSYTSI